MGFFSTIGKLLSSETISFEKRTHVNTAENLLTGDKQNYVGEWRGASTNLSIKPDGTINYRRVTTVGETTNTDTISGPVNQFDGASFVVGVLGQNTRFEVAAPPVDGTMIVNGEALQRV
jgi:hypothetical protein